MKYIRALTITTLVILMSCCIAFADNNQADNNQNEALQQAESVANQIFNGKVKFDKVSFNKELNLYQIEYAGNVSFITPDMKYVFMGDVFDVKTRRSLIYQPKKIKFSDLPSKDAFKVGNGKNEMALFMSLRCPHCIRQYKDLAENKNVTTHIYLYPDAENIWCAPDPKAALDEFIAGKKSSKNEANIAQCDKSALNRNVALARSLKIKSSPTMYFHDGDYNVGYLNPEELNKILETKGRI